MFKQRLKLAAAIFVGSVVLHVLSAAWVEAGGGRGRAGVLGGRDASAQTAPCATWEVRVHSTCISDIVTTTTGNWEPFGVLAQSPNCTKTVVRRCAVR